MTLEAELAEVFNQYWPCEPKASVGKHVDVERLIAEVVKRRVAEERETCAQIAERVERPAPNRAPCGLTAERIAELIRLRGKA